MTDTVKIDIDERGVATVTLNRPDKHNAMSGEMIGDLADTAETLAKDMDIRAVILTGAGKSFCAGGDLGWMRDQMMADAQSRAKEARRLAEMLNTWNSLPKPVIASLHGNAFGGGIGLACVADVAIGANTAKFGLTETRLGLIPATIAPYVIARMGEATARRVFMSSRIFSANEAKDLGILAKTVEPDDLHQATEAEITPYLATAPGAVADAKALARSLGPTIDATTIDRTIDALVQRWESDEAREGISAFFEKRAASWVKNG